MTKELEKLVYNLLDIVVKEDVKQAKRANIGRITKHLQENEWRFTREQKMLLNACMTYLKKNQNNDED